MDCFYACMNNLQELAHKKNDGGFFSDACSEGRRRTAISALVFRGDNPRDCFASPAELVPSLMTLTPSCHFEPSGGR